MHEHQKHNIFCIFSYQNVEINNIYTSLCDISLCVCLKYFVRRIDVLHIWIFFSLWVTDRLVIVLVGII